MFLGSHGRDFQMALRKSDDIDGRANKLLELFRRERQVCGGAPAQTEWLLEAGEDLEMAQSNIGTIWIAGETDFLSERV